GAHVGLYADGQRYAAAVGGAELFRRDDGVAVVQAHAAEFLRLGDAQQTQVAGFLEDFAHGEAAVLLPLFDVGVDLLIDEVLDRATQFFVFLSEVHCSCACLRSSWSKRLQAGYAEGIGLERADLRLGADIQQQAEQLAGVARIDQAVVPQAGGAVQRSGLAVELLRGGHLQHVEHLRIGFLAFLAVLVLGDDAQHLAGLGAAHHRGPAVGPGADEARVQTTAAHGVVAGAVGAADDDGQLGYRAVGHGLDQLGAVLDHAVLFRLGADHEAGGVVEEQDRRVALLAQLDELRCLGRAARGDRTVVADEAAGLTFDVQVAAHGLAVELVLEVEELGAIGDAGDDLANVVGLLGVCRNDTEQLFDRVQRLAPGLLRARRQLQVPRQHADDLAGQAYAVGIVLGQVFGGTGDLGVHFGAAQFFIGGDFAGRSLEQGRAGEEHRGLAAHHYHIVGQARLVGSAGGAGTVHHGDLRNAHGGDACLVGKAACAFDEDIGGVVEVGAAGLGQGDD